jgi:hypothetical protein
MVVVESGMSGKGEGEGERPRMRTMTEMRGDAGEKKSVGGSDELLGGGEEVDEELELDHLHDEATNVRHHTNIC